MKKIISLLLALVMVMGLSVTAFADDTIPADSSTTITAKYDKPQAQYNHVYKVTVAWTQEGTLQYNDVTNVYSWNTDTLVYDKKDDVRPTEKWTITNAKVNITLTNFSDQKVTAVFADPVVVADCGVTSITGSYDVAEAKLTLASAAINGHSTTETGKEQTGQAVYTITAVDGAITHNGNIGTITVTLNPINE